MYESYNPYNPYYNYAMQPQQQAPRQTQPQMYKPQNLAVLQGKVVDSLDVVKATDIPYDGSVSYFPLTDNSAIITKQLQQDGTSKIIIYKPIEASGDKEIKYITAEDLNTALKDVNEKELKALADEIKALKDVKEEIKPLKDEIKSLKKQIRNLEED